jgi:hypothetical protein
MNIMRFHKNVESVERHKMKFPDKYEMMRIAEIIVNNEYHKGNNRFFAYVDMDEEKIRGDMSNEIIEAGILQYVYEKNSEIIKPYLFQKENGKKKYNQETATKEVCERLKRQYFQ